MSEENACCSGPKLIFACSGAADVGAVADQAARKLAKEGTGQMFCLAGIGGRLQGMMQKTASASKILAIDGCSHDCAGNCLEQAGFKRYEHMRVTDLKFEKGKTPVTGKTVDAVVSEARKIL